MSHVLVPPDTPCLVPGFDPAEDILAIALPADRDGGLDHHLAIRRNKRRGFLEVALTHTASGARFLVRMPGLDRLDPSCVAVISLDDAELLAPKARTAGETRSSVDEAERGGPGRGPRKMAFHHRHDWYRDGPPAERYFDLSNPESELDIHLDTENGGSVYAIRLTEKMQPRHPGGQKNLVADTQRSIVLVQASPGTPLLSSSVLAQWFTTRLGSDRFRVIARIWLGNERQYVDADTGTRRRVGRINDSPALAIRGPLAGSVAIER
ncbi:hypothetical protein [Marimonas arenosa]|uniref:Uncharacterized protein n=1 Tax=Marimonas arenosa TaxID=1795305 RepID=A0AAE3WBJ2_9RHOB|nr:hypothetical protein [Marimonas arenosa]MDQ2090181.1 hypothetical protein [Marimonas arenosa]